MVCSDEELMMMFGTEQYVLGSHVYFRGMTKSNFLSGNTASDATYNRLRQWIQNCVSCHSSCGNGHENQIPRRLLDVTPIESGGDPGVRLVEAVSSFGTYTCLSHCWGAAPMTARTVLQNLESYKDFLPWSTLPQNFKDAVIITRRLGIQFVWIDSLCIVQDDKKDWEVESAKMADIYRNASLTIASAWSPDSRGGCFTTTRSDLCFELNGAHGISTLIGARLCDPCDGIGSTTNMKTVKYRFPLFQRAWVYQERLLSTRILYCNYGEFNFECNETSACECSNNILGPHIAGRINNGEYLRRKAVHVTKLRLNHNADLKVITDWWRQMVEEYSSLSLTEPADMLPAISGCAKEIAKITGDVYLSGLWKRTLIDDLLWFQRGKWQPRPAWRAPSWSWASVDTLNGIRYIRNQYAQCTRVIDGKIQQASCELAGENPTGAVKSGCIRLVAGLFPAFMRKFCRSQDLRTDHRGIHDLHAPSTSAAYNTSCQVHEKMLDPRQGRMEFWRDARIDEQELQFSASPAPDSCKECGLAPVYLLHLALMNGLVRGKRTCNDYFMVLRQVSSDSQTYSRIGLLNIVQDSLSARDDWLMEVWNKSVMSEKTVTLI
jgi:hypothetical protein